MNHDVGFLEQLATASQRSTPPDIDEALKIWIKIIKLRPTHIRALYHIGLIYYRDKQDFRNAKVFMKRVVKSVDNEQQQNLTNTMKKQNDLANHDEKKKHFLNRFTSIQPRDFKDWAIIVLTELFILEGEIFKANDALNHVSHFQYMLKSDMRL